MIRIPLAVLAVAIVLTSVVGRASSVLVQSNGVAAGGAAVSSCGSTAAATVTYTFSGALVTGAAVTGLASTCNAGTLTLTLVDAAGVPQAAASNFVSGGATTLTFDPPPNVNNVAGGAHALITGP